MKYLPSTYSIWVATFKNNAHNSLRMCGVSSMVNILRQLKMVLLLSSSAECT